LVQSFTIELDKVWWAQFRKQTRAAAGDMRDVSDLMLDVGKIAEKEWKRRVPNESGAADRSIKARRKSRSAEVWGGGKKAPYLGWLDFGGTVVWKTRGDKYAHAHLQSGDFRMRYKMFIKRPRVEGGRYMYKVVPAKEAEINQKFMDGVQHILNKHFTGPPGGASI
jgi:hypothetical protein